LIKQNKGIWDPKYSELLEKSLERVSKIGPKAREDLKKIPGGRKLLDEHDDVTRTAPEKALSQRKEAAVALKKHRNFLRNPEKNGDDKVHFVNKEKGTGKGRKTEFDVGTEREYIDVKGGNFSNRTSIDYTQVNNQVREATNAGKKPVHWYETMNDALKEKIEKRGMTVRVEDFPMEELMD
jgi:hypothetical protein